MEDKAMAINSVTGTTGGVYQNSAYGSSSAAKASESTKTQTKQEDVGAVYEKSSSTADKVSSKKSNAAILAKLKADADARVSQMRSLVEKMMSQQGSAIGTADSMWSFLAKGNFTVDAAAKAQAQADIAEDGYWGVDQTSDRILDFAKALAGDDPGKADELLSAFKKGFQQATKSWGRDLPDISQRTYDAVLEKFESWKDASQADTSNNVNA